MWTPTFPATAYTIIVGIGKSRGSRTVYFPLSLICKTESHIDIYIKEIRAELERRQEQLIVKSVVVIEIEFSRIWALKAEYWSHPGSGFDPIREKLFADCVESFYRKPTGWLILVTPHSKKGKREYLSAAMPLSALSAERDTEAFMLYSDWVVDKQATHAALYEVSGLYTYIPPKDLEKAKSSYS